jgi:hypothetical protein
MSWSELIRYARILMKINAACLFAARHYLQLKKRSG